MASAIFQNALLLLLIISLACSQLVAAASNPHALLLPVKKDSATLQYLTRISMRTPLTSLPLVLDLDSPFLWVDCNDPTYVSSTRRNVACPALQCALSQETAYTCADVNSCGIQFNNPLSGSKSTVANMALDAAAFVSTDGHNPGPLVNSPDFLFACTTADMLQGLAAGAKGVAGFGRNRVALPLQLAKEFKLQQVFAVCLTSSASSDGVIFIGDGPYELQYKHVFGPGDFVSTPLMVNPVSPSGAYNSGGQSIEYFVGVQSITIMDKAVPLNATLLAVDKQGNGGTKLSTVTPYTTLESSIHKALTDTFASILSKVPRVPAVGKFKLCYNEKSFSSTRLGLGVPQIDFVLQDVNTTWSMFGANTMVVAKPGVVCLAFVDGGVRPRTSIVIGGYQLEDNLLKFDIKNKRLGFTSTLLGRQTTCANFNFTSNR